MAPGDHGSTFAGGPLVCNAANKVSGFRRLAARYPTLKKEKFLANVTARWASRKNGLLILTAGATALLPALKDNGHVLDDK